MSEKPESDDFEEDEVEDVPETNEYVDVDRVMRDMDQARRRGQKMGDPAWRRLERMLEEKRTAELTSDFDDYDIGDAGDDDDSASDGAGGKPRAGKAGKRRAQ
jgi:hypothetical protein